MNLFDNIINKTKSGFNYLATGQLGSDIYNEFNAQNPTETIRYKALQGAANLYSGVAEEAKTGGQMEFEQKKEKARQFLTQKGYSPEVIESTLSQIEYKPSFLGRVREGIGSRMQEVAQTTETLSNVQNPLQRLGVGAVSYGGDIVATGMEPVASAVSPLVQAGIEKAGLTPTVQNIGQQFQSFKQRNPLTGEVIEGVANLSQLAPIPLAKPIGNIAKKGAEATMQGVRKVAPKVGETISKTPQAIGKGVTTGAEYTTSLATGLSREAQQTIKSTPKLYKEARLGNITAQGELENFVKATDQRLTDLSELGTGYDAIKKGNKVANIDDITNAYVKATEGVRDTTLTKADKLVLKDANDYMSQMKGQLDETDILGLRRQLDSIMYDPNTGLKRKVSPNGERVVQTMRAEIDRIAKERIPGLAELDAKYGPEVSLLKDVKKQIYDANGNIKPTALSTISNIVGKNKDFKLAQFQKIYPELGARIKALKAFEEVQALGEIKTGSVIRQGGAIAAGSAVAPGAGTILAWMATNPYIAARVLELYGVAKSKISEMLKKGAKVSPKDAEIVVKAVQNTPKEKMADIINNLSFDPKTNRLTSGNIGPKKLNTMGKMEAAKVPKSIVAQENGIRRPYTLNGNKPIVKRASDTKGPSISNGDEALMSEARKYKSAEEFIKAQTNTYHGTSQTFDSFKKEGLGRSTSTIAGKKGFWFTDSPTEAKAYAKMSGKSMLNDEIRIEKETNALIKKLESAEKKGDWDLADKITREIEILDQSSRAGGLEIVMPIKIDKSKLFVYDASGKSMNQGRIDEVITKAKKEGYEGVTFKNIQDHPEDASIKTTQHIIFDEKNIKTDSELKRIWGKANNKRI